MKERNRTFKIALGGVCLALTLVFMALGSFVPGVELTLFLIASVFTAVMVIETGAGGACLFYAAASLLGFFVIPGKAGLIPYIFCFGFYPILKYFIESLKNRPLQLAAKTVFFAALLTVGLLFFRELLASSVNFPDAPVAVLIIAGTAMMLLYDAALTYLIGFYMRRFRNLP